MHRIGITNTPALPQPQSLNTPHSTCVLASRRKTFACKPPRPNSIASSVSELLMNFQTRARERERAAAARQKERKWLVRRLGIQREDPVLSLAKGGYVQVDLVPFGLQIAARQGLLKDHLISEFPDDWDSLGTPQPRTARSVVHHGGGSVRSLLGGKK